jgi:hypothetical protein
MQDDPPSPEPNDFPIIAITVTVALVMSALAIYVLRAIARH